MTAAAPVLPALAVERSANRKIGDASATSASQSSCPVDCPLFNAGCYAEKGLQGIHTRRLNKSPLRAADRIAVAEAREIAKLSGRRALRLHVVGDARTDLAARILARAAKRYSAKHGAPVWTYTHAWKRVKRASWGAVSVLASCGTLKEAEAAMRAGYAAAMVLEPGERHPVDGKAYMTPDGVKCIPCPEQTRGVQCTSCRLCFDDKGLLERESVIVFQYH